MDSGLVTAATAATTTTTIHIIRKHQNVCTGSHLEPDISLLEFDLLTAVLKQDNKPVVCEKKRGTH